MIRALDLFAGAGGWDVWDDALSIRTESVELADAPVATLRAAGSFVVQADVSEWGPDTAYHLLKGSPPCTEFTVSGDGRGRLMLNQITTAAEDVRLYGAVPEWLKRTNREAALVLEPLRIAVQAYKQRRPFQAIVLEQTKEVLPIWGAVATELQELGYYTAVGKLHAEQYGVPQSRTRAVLIAHMDRPVSLPAPTHGRYHAHNHALRDPGLAWYVSIGKALPKPEGMFLRSNYGTGGVAANRGQRALWQPAPTITRKYNRNKWVDGATGRVLDALTDKEASLLQSFPPGYYFTGSRTEVQLQIGNAIPPLLAKAILECVL